MLSYYEILQVNKDASNAEIKTAYRKLCKILHPDLHNNTREANVIFNLLHEAYETLSDPNRRINYNPEQKINSTSEFSTEKYLEIINGYKKIVKDYQKVIKSNRKRERDLLEEIRILNHEKQQAKQSTSSNFEPDKPKQSEQKYETPNTSTVSVTQIIVWTVVIGIIILVSTIPIGWWFFILPIIILIWLLVSVIKSLT